MKPILYLVTVNLAIEIYSLMDITMMNFWSPRESIAFYKYGNSIEKMLLQVVNTFTMVLVPRISYYYKEKRYGDFNQLVSKGMKLIILTALPMIIGLYFTADFLIRIMYGAQYANSAAVLKMFSVLLLISPTGYLLGSRMLLVTDHESRMVICVGIGAIVNLIGNYFLIPHFHEFGATAASITSETVVMIVYIIYGRKYFQLVKVKESAVRCVIASLLMGGYLLLCRTVISNAWIELLLQITGAVLIYAGSLLVMKEETALQYFNMAKAKLKLQK